MKATITKIDGNKIEFIEEGKKEKLVVELEKWVKPDYVKFGEAEISVKDGKISFCQMEQSTPAKPGATKGSDKPKGNGDDIVDFQTLLSKAYEMKAPFSIKTKMIEIDVEKKYALFQATVEVYATDEQYKKFCIGELSEESKHPVRMLLTEYQGHGDVTADNVAGTTAKHWIRIAETRAIVRALRWYTNDAERCAEEEK